jgi:DNA modification methylase
MITLLTGDCRAILPTLPDASVHMVCTSPPYYSLRSYLDASHPDKQHEIGSEATPSEYIATMVAVFRELRRVLRDDGTCWVNMGDSHAGTKVGNTNGTGASTLMADGRAEVSRLHSLSLTKTIGMEKPAVEHGLAPKQLLMMPARLALALQADGWWVRSDIIWAKPNPMPESCRDRPTSAHEHVFLLTKSGRSTFWTHRDHAGSRIQPEPDYRWVHRKSGEEVDEVPPDFDTGEWRRINLWRGHDYYYDSEAIREPQSEATLERFGNGNAPRKPAVKQGGSDRQCDTWRDPAGVLANGRNARNWWVIATHAFPAAHFATFPPELAERCIRAGTSERGCCGKCGVPWVRVTDKTFVPTSVSLKAGNKGIALGGWERPRGVNDATTTGWVVTCQCNAELAPCVVLDPFSGAGTALLVADRLGRHAIGIDLSHQYVEMARERLRADCPLFADFAALPPAEPPEDERMRDLFVGDEYPALPAVPPKPLQVPRGWDTGPGAHGTIHRTGRTLPEAAD